MNDDTLTHPTPPHPPVKGGAQLAHPTLTPTLLQEEPSWLIPAREGSQEKPPGAHLSYSSTRTGPVLQPR